MFSFFSKQKSARKNPRALDSGKSQFLVPVVIMIMIVPVTLIVPVSFVLIPPPMAVFPAPFSCFMEFVPPVVCLPAVVAVLINRAVQFMVRVNKPSLAIVVCGRSRRTCQHQADR